jgi:hypothetical protein
LGEIAAGVRDRHGPSPVIGPVIGRGWRPRGNRVHAHNTVLRFSFADAAVCRGVPLTVVRGIRGIPLTVAGGIPLTLVEGIPLTVVRGIPLWRPGLHLCVKLPL